MRGRGRPAAPGVPGSRQPVGFTRSPYTRAESDWILRDALANRGVDVVRRNLIWLAVRIGGTRGWSRNAAHKLQAAAEQRVSDA